jgi:phosphatidylinositol alpha-1,6-mannosyltransferase
MKSLLITEQFPPLVGGAAVYFYNLYSRLPPDEIIVLTKKRKGGFEFDAQQKIKIIRTWIWEAPFSIFHPTSIIGPVQLFFIVIFYILRKKIGILHCGTVHPFGECGLLIKKLLGIPYIVYAFGEEIGYFQRSNFKRYIITAVLKNADMVVVMSESTKRMLIGLGIKEEKIFKIAGGANIREVDPAIYTSLRKKLNLQDKKVLLTVSRLTPRKGHDIVLKALPGVLKKFPDTIYLIVGGGATEKKLKELTMQLGLQDKVLFLGEIDFDKTDEYYSICDIFIMVNREIPEEGDVEGFGLVFLEANAYGKPVIGGRSGGAKDAIEDEMTGILINNPLDEHEVAQAILRLLSNEEEAQMMGRKGQKRVGDYFSWEKQKDKVIQLNKKILEKPS